MTQSGQVSFTAGVSAQGDQISRDTQYSTTGSLNSFIHVAVEGEIPNETSIQTRSGSSLQYTSTNNSEAGTVSNFRNSKIERSGPDDVGGWNSFKTVDTTDFKSVTTAYASNGIGQITTKTASETQSDTKRYLYRTYDHEGDLTPNWYVIRQSGYDHIWSASTQSSVTTRRLGQAAAQIIESDYENTGGQFQRINSKNAGQSVEDGTVSRRHWFTINSWYENEFAEGLGEVDVDEHKYSRTVCFHGRIGLENHLGGPSEPCNTTGNVPERNKNDETADDAGQESGRAAFSSLRDGDSTGDSYDPNQNQYRQDGGDDQQTATGSEQDLFAAGFAVGIAESYHRDQKFVQSLLNATTGAVAYVVGTPRHELVSDGVKTASLLYEIGPGLAGAAWQSFKHSLTTKAGKAAIIGAQGADVAINFTKAQLGDLEAKLKVNEYFNAAVSIATQSIAEWNEMSSYDRGRLAGFIAYELAKEAAIEAGLTVASAGVGAIASSGFRAFRYTYKGGKAIALLEKTIDNLTDAVKVASKKNARIGGARTGGIGISGLKNADNFVPGRLQNPQFGTCGLHSAFDAMQGSGSTAKFKVGSEVRDLIRDQGGLNSVELSKLISDIDEDFVGIIKTGVGIDDITDALDQKRGVIAMIEGNHWVRVTKVFTGKDGLEYVRIFDSGRGGHYDQLWESFFTRMGACNEIITVAN